jgi:hypothetical protein
LQNQPPNNSNINGAIINQDGDDVPSENPSKPFKSSGKCLNSCHCCSISFSCAKNSQFLIDWYMMALLSYSFFFLLAFSSNRETSSQFCINYCIIPSLSLSLSLSLFLSYEEISLTRIFKELFEGASSEELDEKAKPPVVQQRGRFKVTSENVDIEKVTKFQY